MAELISVTDEDGTEIIINLDFVVQIQRSDRGAKMSVITIADGASKYAIHVHGSPQRIATWRRLSEGTKVFGEDDEG